MNLRIHQNTLLTRLSGSISAHAANLQRLELARLGQRMEAACQFQDLLAGLKHQIAAKAALRAQAAFAIEGLELQSVAA